MGKGLGCCIVCAACALPAPAQETRDAPSEAARQQALAPFRFILRHADPQVKPKEVRKPKPAPSAQAAASAASAASTTELASVPGPAAAVPAEAPKSAPVAAAPPPAAPLPKPLVPLRQDAPVLSASLQRDAGAVTVAFDIRPDGSTGNVKVLKTTNRRLNAPVIAAVSAWRFQPIDETRSVEVDFVFGEP